MKRRKACKDPGNILHVSHAKLKDAWQDTPMLQNIEI